MLFQATRVDFPAGSGADGLVSSDLDGDGHLDLVVGNSDSKITVLLGTGTKA